MATSVRLLDFTRGNRTVPIDHPDEKEHRRFLAEEIQNILDGKINATGSVTLTASVATTTLSDRRIGPSSAILFSPTTANAAAEALYVTAQGDGTATLNHANNAQTDRTYNYAVLG